MSERSRGAYATPRARAGVLNVLNTRRRMATLWQMPPSKATRVRRGTARRQASIRKDGSRLDLGPKQDDTFSGDATKQFKPATPFKVPGGTVVPASEGGGHVDCKQGRAQRAEP